MPLPASLALSSCVIRADDVDPVVLVPNHPLVHVDDVVCVGDLEAGGGIIMLVVMVVMVVSMISYMEFVVFQYRSATRGEPPLSDLDCDAFGLQIIFVKMQNTALI